jgi:hypothetical protein
LRFRGGNRAEWSIAARLSSFPRKSSGWSARQARARTSPRKERKENRVAPPRPGAKERG